MTSIKHDCPYCGSSSSAFQFVSDTQSQVKRGHWYSMARCGVCKEIALIRSVDTMITAGRSTIPSPPSEFGIVGVIEERYSLLDFFPLVPETEIPEALPENVYVSFEEAESAFAQKLFSSAAACYRKSIERAVKILHPDGKGTLNARIREIEKKGILPKTLVELLDRVRILGNQSVHEEEYDPTSEDCEVARHFSRLFLVYTFSLPAQIDALKNEYIN